MEESKKLFGKFTDLLLLLIGFILTTIVGGYLSQQWQDRSEKSHRIAQQKLLEQQAATKVFEELSKLMDKRLYRMRQVHIYQNRKDKKLEKLKERWDNYRKSLFEWNENLNRNLALVQRYFGQKSRDILEGTIQKKFIQFGQLLEGNGFPNNLKSKYTYKQDFADNLNNIIYDFDIYMITEIQLGNIGSFRK